jgi:hypothetical protein
MNRGRLTASPAVNSIARARIMEASWMCRVDSKLRCGGGIRLIRDWKVSGGCCELESKRITRRVR